MTEQSNTAILAECRCGWIGMAHSSETATQNWHDHAFSARGGCHERVREMAVAIPADGRAVGALVEEVTGLNALGMFRKHEHLPFERRGMEMVERRKHAVDARADEQMRLLNDERQLRRGLVNALGFAGIMVMVVVGIVVLWRIKW